MNANEVKQFEKQIREAYSAISKEQDVMRKVADNLNKEWQSQQNAYFKSQIPMPQTLKTY